MTCDEFRRCWLDAEPFADGPRDSRLDAHRVACLACRAWAETESSFDRAIARAFVVAVPPDLAARLAVIPAANAVPLGPPFRVPLWESFVEALLLVAVGLAALSFGGPSSGLPIDLTLDRLTAFLQAIPLVLNPPLLGYLGNLALTMTEAMATLLLLGIGIVRFSSPDTPLIRAE